MGVADILHLARHTVHHAHDISIIMLVSTVISVGVGSIASAVWRLLLRVVVGCNVVVRGVRILQVS